MPLKNIKPAFFEGANISNPKVLGGQVQDIINAVNALTSTEINLVDATKSYSVAQNGKTVIATKASGTQTFTIPAASTAGLTYSFICGHASGEILINSANSSDTFSIKASEGGASVVTAAGTGIKNTAATNVLGDHITLISNGATGWYGVAQSGTWASQ